MKEKILEFLKEHADYVSGEEISRNLGVTRTSIWKLMNKLKQEGYEIESSTRKGYKLIHVPNIITKEEVGRGLRTKVLGQEIQYFSQVTSTNDKVKEFARAGSQEGLLVIADEQTTGKGRRGRAWESPSGACIFMSLLLKPNIRPDEASQLTLIAGLGMCEAIIKNTGLKAQIKWPNDIVINGKKVSGILTEMSAEIDGIDYIVVGIGVNVNNDYFPGNLPFATSLALEGGKEYIRLEIIRSFLEIFEKDYFVYKEEPKLEKFLERYRKVCITLGNKVKIIGEEEEYISIAKDIASDGTLIIENEKGETKTVVSGEVSVRGLYGYTN